MFDAGDPREHQLFDDLRVVGVGSHRNVGSASHGYHCVDHVGIQRQPVRLVAGFVQTARGHELDDAGTVVQLFAYRSSSIARAKDGSAQDRGMSARSSQRAAGSDDSRSHDPACGSGLARRYRQGAGRAHVANRCNARLQVLLGVV